MSRARLFQRRNRLLKQHLAHELMLSMERMPGTQIQYLSRSLAQHLGQRFKVETDLVWPSLAQCSPCDNDSWKTSTWGRAAALERSLIGPRINVKSACDKDKTEHPSPVARTEAFLAETPNAHTFTELETNRADMRPPERARLLCV